MTQTYLLGIDVGTSAIKAVLFDSHGHEVHSSCRASKIYNDGACSEMDMNELWQDVAITIKNVTGKMASGSTIAAAAVSGQGEGLWLIDNEGAPVGRAILWNDNRAEQLVRNINTSPVLNEQIRKITGSSLFPGATSVLLRWMQENSPKQLDQAHKLLFCKDWIRFKLTGVIGTDITDTSTSLTDIKKSEPTDALFDHLKIGKQLPLIPLIFKPDDQAGTISNEAAESTGLPRGMPVAIGAFDVAASAAGCGTIHDGDACVILGTSGCTIVVSDTLTDDLKSLSGKENHVIPNQFITVTATMAATPNIDWVYNLFHTEKTFADVEEELQSIPAGCHGLIYHPYISSSGERAPFYAPGASAQFSGINEKTTPLTMTRAVYEGVAFSIKDCLRHQKPERLFLAGGGARSSFWAHLIANCTGLPIFLSTETELCARGSALMAGTAAGIYKNLEHAVDHLSEPQRIDPDPDQVSIYEDLFKQYRQIQKAMMPIWTS